MNRLKQMIAIVLALCIVLTTDSTTVLAATLETSNEQTQNDTNITTTNSEINEGNQSTDSSSEEVAPVTSTETTESVTEVSEGETTADSTVETTDSVENTELLLEKETHEVSADKATGTIVDFDYTMDDTSIVLTKYTGTNTDITVPSKLSVSGSEYSVIVTKDTFAGNTSIVNVVFESGVTATDNDFSSGFKNCTSLKSVTGLPEGITSLVQTFYSCSALTSAPVIPDTVTDMQWTFISCTALTSAPVIPNGVTNMNSTFNSCKALTVAPEIPDSVTSMESTFEACSALTTAPTIPSSVTSMARTFRTCTYLQGSMLMKAAPSSYEECFYGAATKVALKVYCSATATNIDSIVATKSTSGKITTAKYKVTFDSQDGSAVDAQDIVWGGKVTNPTDPTKSGYTFKGWYKEAECTNAWDFATETITKDSTIYAKWISSFFSDYEFKIDGEHIILTKYIGIGTSVNVPATCTYSGTSYKIQITNSTFSENKSIEEVTFEEGVSVLNNDFGWGFSSCFKLKSVSGLPNGITNMSDAFASTALTSAPFIPDSVTNLKEAFISCTKLTSAPVIPNSVTNMGYTFASCFALTSAPVIPNSVTNMEQTFADCSALTSAPAIPNSVTNMSNTFDGCSALASAPTIPDSVTNMNFTFRNCTSLTSAPVIPDSVTTMESTFQGSALTNAPTIPSSVKNMKNTFRVCDRLQGSMIMKAAPTEYTDCFAYAAMSGKTLKVYYSASATNIESVVATKTEYSQITISKPKVTFDSLNGSAVDAQDVIWGEKVTKPTDPTRTGYTFGGWYKEATYITAWDFATETVTQNITLYAKWTETYTTGYDNYKDYEYYYDTTTEANDIVLTKYIGTNVNVVLPSSFNIGETKYQVRITADTYTENSTIETVDIADGVTLLNSDFAYGFYNCTKLKSVTGLPNNILTMVNTFKGCSSLTSVTLPNGLISLNSTFAYCTSLTTAPVIPSTVTNMSDAFANCSALTVAPTIPDSVTNMYATFKNCTALITAPKIPSNVTDMDLTFNNCSALTTVSEIPSKVTSMWWTFNGCTNLQGSIIVKAVPTNYAGCLIDAAITNPLVIYYTATDLKIDDFVATKAANSLITKGTFKVNFNSQGGSVVDTQLIDSGNKASKPSDPTRTGYIFGGWYKEADCTTTWDFATQTLLADTTLYTKWTDSSCVVTFDSQGGNTVNSQTVYIGDKVSEPTAPTRTGYTFKGWYKESSCKNVWTFSSDTISGATTLYAKWATNLCRITFDSQGGSQLSVPYQDIYAGTKPDEPDEPTRTGYTFGGWYKQALCTNVWNFSSDNVTQDITLYAKWTVISYAVTFDSQGGSSVDSQTINYGEKVTLPTAPTKEGYAFGGWYTDTTYATKWDFNLGTISGNTMLYARWLNYYTVTFESNGGSSVDSKPMAEDSLILLPNSPTKEGFVFAGWCKDSECTTLWNANIDVVKGNISLYAKWSVNGYTLKFNSQGGSSVASQTVYYGDKVAAPTAPTKNHYTFLGWYTESECTTVWNFDNNVIVGDATLYAKWLVDNYTVSFNSQDGSSVASQIIDYDSKVTKPSAPKKTGYTFGGWYKESTCENVWDFDSDKITEATTLYAKWTINSYAVTFDSVGGNSIAAQTINYGEKVVLPFAPIKTGYKFDGWYKDKAYTTAWDFASDTIGEETTLYAKWLGACAVTFETNGGTSVGAESVLEGELLDLPNAPIKEGFVFAGWCKDSEAITLWNANKDVVTKDIILYAKWSVNGYTVKFNSQGGSNVPSQTLYYGNKIILTIEPTKAGYTFGGWYTEAECTTNWNFNKYVVSGDTMLYAKWAANSNLVAFDSMGGSSVTAQNITSGSKVSQPADPTRAGYIFGGWYQDAVCTVAWNFSADMVTANTTLYAKWTGISYTVSFNSMGGSSVAAQTITSGSKAALPANPTRAGYTLSGWYQDFSYTTAWNFDTNVIAADITLYAKWSEVKVDSITQSISSVGVAKGSSTALNVVISPSNALNTASNWTSSDSKIAIVNASGVVAGVGYGTTMITATAQDGSGKSASATVTVGYGITYKLNGGTNNTANPSSYYRQKINFKNPSRVGYKFSGWYTDKKFKKSIKKIKASEKKFYTVYAKWTKIKVSKASISSAKNSKKSTLAVGTNKISGVSGYEIQYATDKKFTQNLNTITQKKTSATIKSLVKGTTYYVRVRAYTVDSTGSNVYGKYSSVKKIKITK